MAVLATSALVASLAGAARAAETSFNHSRTILFNGEPTFPLVLSARTTAGHVDALGNERPRRDGGRRCERVPDRSRRTWASNDIQSAIDWDRAAAALHVYT